MFLAKSNVYLILSFFIFTIQTVFAAKFPSNWEKCPKTNNEECLKTSIENVIKDLKSGNKGLNVIGLDPLHLQRMEIQQGGTSPVNINLTFYEVDLIGHSKLNVKSAKADWDNYKIDISFLVDDYAYVLGDYTIEGKILVLPIQGNGKANCTFERFACDMSIQGSEMIKNGKKYFKVDKVDYKINPKRVWIWLSNLFNGVPNLGDNMNKFLNDNWRVILDELKETISLAMGQAVIQIANNFFHNIPVTDLYTS